MNLLNKENRQTTSTPVDSEQIVKTVQPNSEQQPVVVLKAICKPSLHDTSEILMGEYHSHFIVYNDGDSPAIEVELALLDNRQEWLDTQRETILRANESLEFRPILHRPAGRYYILCQYKQVSSQDEDAVWSQTRLPFNLIKASKKGEVYVSPGELEFKFGIPKEDKFEIFINKPK